MKHIAIVLSLALVGFVVREASGEAKVLTPVGSSDRIRYEEFGPAAAEGCVVVLHGASGPTPEPYGEQARFFGKQGFRALMPSYYDATRTRSPTTENYAAWAKVAAEFVALCREGGAKRVFLVGYSLGASVALAAGSQGVAVDAIADMYGSLPDDFFHSMKAMPPLIILHGEGDSNIPIVNARQLVKLCELRRLQCEHHFYPDQGHGFDVKAMEDADARVLAFFAGV